MKTIQIIKVKSKANGYWLSGLRDVLRTMRESADFLIAIKSEFGFNLIDRSEIIGKPFKIKDQVFIMRPDSKIMRIHANVTT